MTDSTPETDYSKLPEDQKAATILRIRIGDLVSVFASLGGITASMQSMPGNFRMLAQLDDSAGTGISVERCRGASVFLDVLADIVTPAVTAFFDSAELLEGDREEIRTAMLEHADQLKELLSDIRLRRSSIDEVAPFLPQPVAAGLYTAWDKLIREMELCVAVVDSMKGRF